MLREANRQFTSPWAEKVTIKYDLKKTNETNSNWATGDTFEYQDVPCLKEIISNVTFADNQTANIVIGKANFFIPYNNYDFHNNQKRNIKIIDSNGMTYLIDKVLPMVPLVHGYVYWMLVQK